MPIRVTDDMIPVYNYDGSQNPDPSWPHRVAMGEDDKLYYVPMPTGWSGTSEATFGGSTLWITLVGLSIFGIYLIRKKS